MSERGPILHVIQEWPGSILVQNHPDADSEPDEQRVYVPASDLAALQAENERLREAGNRLAVVAEDCHDRLLRFTGSADGHAVIGAWWSEVAALHDTEPEPPAIPLTPKEET